MWTVIYSRKEVWNTLECDLPTGMLWCHCLNWWLWNLVEESYGRVLGGNLEIERRETREIERRKGKERFMCLSLPCFCERSCYHISLPVAYCGHSSVPCYSCMDMCKVLFLLSEWSSHIYDLCVYKNRPRCYAKSPTAQDTSTNSVIQMKC